MKYTKVISCSTSGRIRNTTASKGTQARINELVRELGIPLQEYKLKASIRLTTALVNKGFITI